MSIYFQIGLGLLPGTIAVLFLLFKRKAFNIRKVIFSIFLFLICSVSLFVGLKNYVADIASNPRLSKKETITFANSLVLKGAYEQAFDVLDEYSETFEYDDECRLLTARINLLSDKPEQAKALYNYLSNNSKIIKSSSEEVLHVNSYEADSYSNLLKLQYLESIGAKIEEYGFSTTSKAEILKKIKNSSINNIKNSIHQQILNQYKITSNMEDYAKAVYELSIDKKLDDSLESKKKKHKRIFDTLEEEMPELLQLECVSNAKLKASIAIGDYSDIVEKLGKNSSYHELMVASELYMGDFVNENDFVESFAKIDEADADLVKNQLDKIYEKNYKNLSQVERKNLKARVNAISNQLNDVVLLTIKEQLIETAEQSSGSDKTKVYLEVAKIEHYFDNEAATNRYLKEAIYSSPDCEDDNYVYGMSQIISVIENNDQDELENIKKVSEYVDIIIDNSLTIDVKNLISPEEINKYETKIENSKNQISFSQTAVDYVSRAKFAISIGKVDASKFDTVTARVQITSNSILGMKSIKDEIKVYDCGAEIKDYSLNKINYSGTNILLVCDVSGSMSGSIQNLRDAVVTFIKDKNEAENISVVTFNESIVETMSFGTPDKELISFAQSMQANGGTDMFSAVVNCLGDFSVSNNSNNILILITDGHDNDPKSANEIYDQIGALATQKGVTVYSMGLEEQVDTVYLNTIASSGNGEFLYVSDSVSLTSFYDMLHEQLNNQYEISYKAIDTLTAYGRTLEVMMHKDNTRDIKSYALRGNDGKTVPGLEVYQGISISGLSPRYLYKGNQDVKVYLKGTGFTKEHAVNVSLNGNIDYKISAEYVDSGTYSLVIPSSIAVGDYNVEISINGKKKIIDNGFSVIVQGDEKKTQFGPYIFTSNQKIKNTDGSYTLRGLVTLNGWLRFKGDVDIAGDLENAGSINVAEYSGSYVEFDKVSAEGIGKIFANKNIALDVPILGRFRLYNDQDNLYDYEKYQVDEIRTGLLTLYQLMRFDSPKIKLYPNSVGLYFSTGTSILPYQDKIIDADDLFSFKLDTAAQITDRNVGVILDLSYGDPDGTYNHQINLLNSPVYLNGSVNLKINTIKNEYSIGAMASAAFFAKQSGFGVDVSWKENLVPDSVKLSIKLGKPLKLPTSFPVEIKDFSFMVSDINQAVENGKFTNLKFTGSTSLSSMAIAAYAPKIAKIVGEDLSLLEMPDTTATIRLSPFTLEADASLMFLSEIKIAEAGIKMGNFEYTNTLLNIDSEDVAGLSARVKIGVMWDTADDRINLELSGAGQLDAHSKFIGIGIKGTAAYDIGWWLINCDRSLTGEFAFGLYTTHDNKSQIVFVYKTQDTKGKVSGKFYYIDENGKCGSKGGILN